MFDIILWLFLHIQSIIYMYKSKLHYWLSGAIVHLVRAASQANVCVVCFY